MFVTFTSVQESEIVIFKLTEQQVKELEDIWEAKGDDSEFFEKHFDYDDQTMTYMVSFDDHVTVSYHNCDISSASSMGEYMIFK